MTPTSTTARKESESGFKQDYLDLRKTYSKPQILPIEYDEAIVMERCSKPNCHYCDLMNRKQRDDIPFRSNGWSNNDLATLEKEYAMTPMPELERILNRSANAIMYKASKIGVKKVVKTYKGSLSMR